MKLFTVALALFSFLSLNSFAKMTVIEDQKCLDVTSDLVGKALRIISKKSTHVLSAHAGLRRAIERPATEEGVIAG